MSQIDALWDFNDPETSESRFREALAAAEGDQRIEIATQVARALGLQGKFAEGHSVLDTLPALDGGRAATRVALERGRLFNSAGDREQATRCFAQAAELASAAGEYGLELDAIHMLAIADPTKSEEWTLAGLARIEETGDPDATRWTGPLLNNLGWALFDAGRLEEARDRFQQSGEFYRASGKAGQVAIARWSEARCLREEGQIQAALAIQLDLAETNPEPDPYVFDELATLFAVTGDQESEDYWRSLADNPDLSR